MLSKSRQFGEISVHHEFYRKVTTLMRKVNIHPVYIVIDLKHVEHVSSFCEYINPVIQLS